MSKMVIEDGKFVELTYKVIDKKTKEVLSEVEFPLGYIQGISEGSRVTIKSLGSPASFSIVTVIPIFLYSFGTLSRWSIKTNDSSLGP
jgi:hypothetical protein